MQAHRPRVAVVIGSGGVKCTAGIGMVRALSRAGVQIDLLVGTSAGAMVAAGVAMGLSSDECTAMAMRLWTRKLTSERDNMAMLRALLPRVFGFSEHWGMKRDGRIMVALDQAFGQQRLEGCRIPLLVTATDFFSGEQLAFSQGLLTEVIRASIAIPFIFTPWRVDGRTCIDGCVSDPLPIAPAVRAGADVIIAMGFESPLQERIPSAGRFAFQLSAIMNNNLQKARLAFDTASHGEVLVIAPTFRERVRLFDTDKIPAIVEEGERATEAVLPRLWEMLGRLGRESAQSGRRHLSAVCG